jgi:hypothetical protein
MLNRSVRGQDRTRLRTQLDRVRAVLFENFNRPLTLAAIARKAKAPQASASARIRDVRSEGATIRVVAKRRGLHTYTLVGFVHGSLDYRAEGS